MLLRTPFRYNAQRCTTFLRQMGGTYKFPGYQQDKGIPADHIVFESRAPPPQFTKYTEFDSPKEANLRKQMLDPNVIWCAQEKVHGANFGMHCYDEGRDIRFAKRTAFIRDNEFFFGYTRITPKLSKAVPYFRDLLREKFGHIDAFIVFGEIFGGKYTHPHLGQEGMKEIWHDFRGQRHRIAPIQMDIFPQYHPDIHFFAFEIKYRSIPDGEWITCTVDESVSIFEQVPDFLYGKVLLRGPLKHCLAFNMDTYQTVLPHVLGLGDYVLPGNFAEGLIMRTTTRGGLESKLNNSNDISKGFATILKFKHRMFQETRHANKIGERDPLLVLQAEISREIGETIIDPASYMKPNELKSLKSLTDLVCENRLMGMLSKTGLDVFNPKSGMDEKDMKTQEDLANLVAKDAMKDWLKIATPSELRYTHFVKIMFANHVKNESDRLVAKRWNAIQKGQFD